MPAYGHPRSELELRDYDPKTDRTFVRSERIEFRAAPPVPGRIPGAPGWLKVRGSFRSPIFLSNQKRPIDRTTLHLLMKKYDAAAGILPHNKRRGPNSPLGPAVASRPSPAPFPLAYPRPTHVFSIPKRDRIADTYVSGCG